MAAPVYSTLFVSHAAVNGGPYLEYTVPTGMVAVIKCMTIVYGDITASGLDAWLQTDDLAKLARYTWATTLSSPQNFGGTALFFGSWVLDAATELYTQTATGTCDIVASGYLLSLP